MGRKGNLQDQFAVGITRTVDEVGEEAGLSRESPPVCTLTQTPEESLLGLLLSLAFWAGLMGLGRGLGWGVEEASRNQAAPRARGLQG